MILTDGITTYTNTEEKIKEDTIKNGNIEETIGFVSKAQADARKLKWESQIRVKQSDMAALDSILSNFAVKKYYTPQRKLAYKSSISSLEVVIVGEPKIDQRLWTGEIVFWVTIQFQEVYAA